MLPGRVSGVTDKESRLQFSLVVIISVCTQKLALFDTLYADTV